MLADTLLLDTFLDDDAEPPTLLDKLGVAVREPHVRLRDDVSMALAVGMELLMVGSDDAVVEPDILGTSREALQVAEGASAVSERELVCVRSTLHARPFHSELQ